MTCIVALEFENKVFMGGDSAAVSGWDIQVTAEPKVFRLGEFLIGYTSSFRMGQLLRYNLAIPENTDGDDDMKYLVTKFIPAVRECLKSGGFARVDNNQESGGFFLVGYRGKAYVVNSDFQITRMVNGFVAVGCGENYALGALAAMQIEYPETAILRALEIAGMFSNGVCAPYYVISENK